MKFFPHFSADLVTFTEEILNGKLDFTCAVFISLISTSPFLSHGYGILEQNNNLV